jgi:beta-phosphoglucomutase-like phosphatase (HAD superfamily)
MPRYSEVFIDFDGCLYQSIQLWVDTCYRFLRNRGLEIDTHTIVREIMPHLDSAEHHGVVDVNQFVDEVLVHVGSLIIHSGFNAGALPFIQALAENGIPYAVVTSSFRNNIDLIVSHYGVADLFPIIIARDDVTHKKPHPEGLLLARQKIKSSGAHGIMIGDNAVDIVAGKNIGIDTALYFPEFHGQYYFLEVLSALNPTHVVNNFNDLISIILDGEVISSSS